MSEFGLNFNSVLLRLNEVVVLKVTQNEHLTQ